MKIILTNDDGIDAPGLRALEEATRDLGELLVVAPATPLSGCGHQVTTERSIEVVRLGPRRFSVDGTPADCVRVGLGELAPDTALVLAGINHGGNLGVDVYMSGTVAAARESAIHGVAAVALSQYRRRDLEILWDRSGRWAREVLNRLLADGLGSREGDGFWNINLPHLPALESMPAVVVCGVDPSPLPLRFQRADGTASDQPERREFRYAGVYHDRPRRPGADIDVCMGGRIAISEVGLNAPATGSVPGAP